MSTPNPSVEKWTILVDYLRDKLHARKGEWRRLSKDAPYTYRWVVAFAARRSDDRIDPKLLLALADRMGEPVSWITENGRGIALPAARGGAVAASREPVVTSPLRSRARRAVARSERPGQKKTP